MFDDYSRESYVFKAGSLGHIEGLTITSHGSPAIHYFGGLPYALPPVGQWRFRVPRRLPKDYRYGTATEPGKFTDGTNVCPQPASSNTPDPSVVSEDCLQLNIWVPAGPPPKHGWPVCFYIHGGFLQVGTSNTKPEDLVSLLSESAFRAIIVMPSYRLNVFGFLASEELAAEASSNGEATGNYGLWDQRLALEWTHENISLFGGDPGNITVAGYSAGAYSTFQQLAHELFRVPEEKAIIRRVAMFSNSTGVRPKSLQDQQLQCDELLTRLGINLALSGEEKLASLRAVPHNKLVQIQTGMAISEFRVLADDTFYPVELMDKINNGEFSKRMKNRGITLINGECESEHIMYHRWRTPQESYSAVCERLLADFSPEVTQKIMDHYCGSSENLPAGYNNWEDFFGRVYANIQVHYLQRGFHNALFAGSLEAGKDVFRYRLEKRLDCVAEKIPLEWGVTHLTDIPIWLWGCGYQGGLSDQEKKWLKGWNESFAAFVNGDEVNWGTTSPKDMRRWRSDGETDICEDDLWEDGVEFWRLVNPGLKENTEGRANH
ncbi:triacylglycerol lipase V precursor [Fusarium mundagurra]|uniref:Carboxylic ester hydrolase n=1 Tax=Fusarium mundagurra TaxID=1567541 RepID=A0A8H6DCM9_9HYPO|nr:triacylglycerol lipase V precursor [Fusarium mundagurra]